MEKVYLICITVMWVVLGCSPVENVSSLQPQTVQEQNQATISPFYLEYSISESLPDPRNGENRKRQYLKVRFDAAYELSQEVILTGNEIGYSHNMNGVFFKAQLARLEQILKKLDLPTIDQSSIVLASGVEYGWGGYVKYAKGGKSYHTKFTAQYSQGQFTGSGVRARFLTFIREMDNFFRVEFNL
jgi:hypothetical protein